MKTTFKFEGGRELERALAEELPKATARNALTRTAKNSLERVVKYMEQHAPRDEGELAGSMKTQAAKAKLMRAMGTSRREGVLMLAGPAPKTKAGRANAGFQEFGTVKQAAQSYARPAADTQGEQVIREVRDELTKQIDKAKARIARKAAKAKG